MTRARLVIGNWKMNPATADEATRLAREVAAIGVEGVALGIAPPSIALAAVADAVRGSALDVYAQDVHWEETGAYTGQISAGMLRGIAHGAIVGHSEVRRDQGDDDSRVAKKAARALAGGLRVIYCLGESLEQRKSGATDGVLGHQVREGLGAIPRELMDVSKVAIAYEPIWAIGTGVPASGAQASAAIRTLRTELTRLGLDAATVTILYGGSVSTASVAEFARADGVDGALVGGASLKADEFAAIVAAFR